MTAQDQFGNTASGYTGTVHFTSSDGQATLPANYTFTAADAGVHVISVILKTAGTQSLTATDTATSSITGSQTGIQVRPATATHFQISAPASVQAGVAFTITVTALDAYGNTATAYTGTVHFTSSDGKAVLPGNYRFRSSDAGVHVFSVTLNTQGTQTVTATDTLSNTATATLAVFGSTPLVGGGFHACAAVNGCGIRASISAAAESAPGASTT